MINHARTLILNEPPSPGTPGEQFIDASFNPAPLTAGLASIHNLCIHPSWPRDYRNFAATLLAAVLADSPYQRLIDQVDPRSTINFGNLGVGGFLSTVTSMGGGANFQVMGTYQPSCPAGIYSTTWQLTGLGNTTMNVVNQRSGRASQLTLTFTGDTTPDILLDPTNNISFQFVGLSSIPPGFSATVTGFSAMSYDLMGTLQKLRSNEDAGSIFTTGLHPALTELGNAFNQADWPSRSLAAILAAYVLSL